LTATPTYSKKNLPARDKSTSRCIFNLCKIRLYAGWPEHALLPIGGAKSCFPLLSAIRALRRGKFNQGVCTVKDGVKRVGYWPRSVVGEQQRPPCRGKMLKLINSKI
jgi:hypothetical protein